MTLKEMLAKLIDATNSKAKLDDIPEITQTTGTATDKVMSQAAVTEITRPITDEEIEDICNDDDEGEPVPLEAVLFVPQTLTEAEKKQARENTGIDEYLTDELAKRGQLKFESVNSIEDCTDTNKMYILPDGFIYAWMYTESEVGGYTNRVTPDADGFQAGYRIKAAGGTPVTATGADATTAFVSGIVECKKGDVLRIRGVGRSSINSATAPIFMVVPVDSSGNVISNHGFCLIEPLYNSTQSLFSSWKQAWNAVETAADGTITWTYAINNAGENQADMSLSTPSTAVRIAGTALNGFDNIIVTVNEKIVEPSIVKEYRWTNTGRAATPTDYENRIIALEDNVRELSGYEQRVAELEGDVFAIKDSMQESGVLDHSIFDYAYIKNKELIANALETEDGAQVQYTGAKMEGSIKRIMCKAKFAPNSSVVLISTKLGSSYVANITRGSVHLIFSMSGCAVGIYDGGTSPLRNVIQYSCSTPADTEVSFGYEVSGTALTVYLPDGTTKTVTDDVLPDVNGQYAIWEHYCARAGDAFHTSRITKLWCASADGDVLDDDLKRQDGAIGTAPTGQTYRQFRTGQQTDRDFK